MEKKNQTNQIDYDKKLMLTPLIKKHIISFEDSPPNQFVLKSLEIIRISFSSSFEAHGLSMAIITGLSERATILYFKNFSHIDWHACNYIIESPTDDVSIADMFITFLPNGKLKIDFCNTEDEDSTCPIISLQCDAVMDMSLKECREILEKEIRND